MQSIISTLCAFLLLALSWSTAAQPDSGAIGQPPPPLPPPPQCLPSPYHLTPEEEPFKMVEEMPRFPDAECEALPATEAKRRCSEKKLLEFIYGNLKYPFFANAGCIEGTAIIRFVIEKDGSVTNTELVRDIGAHCGEEALRVIGLMNEQGLKWIPGKQRGRPVRVQFNIPIKSRPDSSREEPASNPAENEKTEIAEEALLPAKTNLSGTPPQIQVEGFRLFPNPAGEWLSVRFQATPGPLVLIVANSSGQVLWRRQYEHSGDAQEQQISLEHWPPGAYLLSIRQENSLQTQAFIKQ